MQKILAFGNPLLDTIVFTSSNDLLGKYKLELNGQKEITSEEMAYLLNDIKSCEKTISSGGCAQNTLKVLQWLSRKQCSATIFGAVGNDEAGQQLKSILKRSGVFPNYVIHDNFSTGCSVALVNGENRSLFAHLGAAEILSINDVESNRILPNQIQNSEVIYIEGFFITKREQVSRFILNKCKVLNKVVAFNVCGVYLSKEYPETVMYFITECDIVFGNRNELLTLYGEDNLDKYLTDLSKNKKIIVTDGGNPIHCYINCSKIIWEVPKLEKSDIVDTTGAGDAFVGGFLLGYVHKQELNICLKQGNYAAQEIIKQKGCSIPNYPPLK